MTKQWYVVHTYSGFEDKVKISIEDNARRRGLSDKISQILIPSEKVMELKSGKKKETTKKFYPGYILIEMELDDETWHLVSSTPRVSGFVGGDKPAPLQQEEIDVIVQQIEKGPSTQVKTHFDRGDSVRIIDGAFANFNGFIDEIDEDHDKLRVMVTIFGRQTPVELNFLQVEKT
ncbi:MAG TPA: transcription termination/antitermination factor NusG [Nitrospirae bacterium]|nr:transcription termination/antitermination factor NusG [Nitrospirota bacterium]HDZ02705.1 transcription termination/antitermination factor NusG [Nitrospirota bacterium]